MKATRILALVGVIVFSGQIHARPLSLPVPKPVRVSPIQAAAWRQARSPDPRGGSDYEALLQTADFARSDPGLAGMMVRCREGKIESIFVVVEPLPPRSAAQVRVTSTGFDETYLADVIPTGAGLAVPLDMAAEIRGRLRHAPDLSVTIRTAQGQIGGAISLEGLATPLDALNVACASVPLKGYESK